MINTTDFTKRLQKVMDYYGITAAILADELGIQRSGISHLMSERNKPSLDFVLKLRQKYPEVDIYWLVLGEGVFPSEENKNEGNKNSNYMKKEENRNAPNLVNPVFQNKNISENNILNTDNQYFNASKKNIKKIIFFFEDNSFEIFEN